MDTAAMIKAADTIYDNLRLRTFPIGVRFMNNDASFPEKTRRPSKHMSKRITVCQAVTLARTYGWTVGLTKDDLKCVPAMLALGMSRASDPKSELGGLWCEVGLASDAEKAGAELDSMTFLEGGEIQGLLMAPLRKGAFKPDLVVIYGNPAQMMRLVQSWTFMDGHRVVAQVGGKVECSEYLMAPFRSGEPRLAIPGLGDRIFSMTQDDEMVFALPFQTLGKLTEGLSLAGVKIGTKYPVTFYMNYEPEMPPNYAAMGRKVGLFED
jgi:uncharacterized protein (DUF169 family)